ncbi:uncharacterized protein LOC114536703 [Dendronephthya gigantea]|uniref:uncharacterized protein LOC114536703 n=1 Tax=Dendronephthya gigantea TaxID=151771 RepID=UPI0010697EBA|nr:uncharacterized protein LOC114536703 [Dendronephthya gigantea]
MKQSILDRGKTAKQTLDEVYCTSGDVIKARSIGQLPRGPSDLYYARHSAKKMPNSSPLLDQSKKSEAKETSQPASIDSMWTLLERAKREEQSKEDVFIRECSIHPNLFVVLANDRQLDEVANFCTHPSEHSVFGIDPTFNIFDRNISLTVTTYRNLKLVNPKTGKQPVFVGPLLMHQKKDWKTFSKFAHSLVTLKPELDAVLACGTDGERALVNGFKRNMRFAVFLRCFLHFKANIERELISRGITGNAKKEFVCEIFGKQEGDIKYFGLVDCESEEEFDEKLQQLQPIWEEREIVTENKERKQTMFEWFKREKAQDIKDSMLRPIRTEAGLGNPPSEYTNNDPEAANFIIKHGLHFNPNKPHEFIENVKEIILTQQRNEDRAVFGKGPYRVREGFTHLSVDDVERSSLSHAQMEKRLADFNKAKMDSRVDVVSPTPQDQEDEPTSRLSVTANESGITTVPQPILEAMFERASNLLAVPGKVIPKPGADDGSFVVAGLSNNIHCVNPGKGGSLSCDRSCINYATKICEHTLAVAQVRGTLSELLTWFKRRKKRPAMMEMVEQSGPKTAGRKPSQRKRTNVKRPTVNEYVDLLRPPTSQMLPDVPSTIQHASIPSTNIYTQPPTFSSVERMTQVMPTAPDTSTFQTDYPSMATGFPIPGSYSIPQQCTNQHLSENFQFSPVSSVTLSDQSHMNAQGSVGLPESYFYLKWVEGTRVSKCYGCDGVIQNPPTHRPDDLIIVCRDMREYRDRLTGQRQKSNTVQNVHFHLYKECVIRRYPNFHVGLLKIDGFQINHLQPEHLQRLATNFGWNLYR